MSETTKATNPKAFAGTKKIFYSCIPWNVIAEASVGMLEGGLKYGRHNYRVAGVKGSIYFDATMRHLTAWWEGEDIDPDSKLSHITKAITSLMVLRDAMLLEKWTDDRPPKEVEGWMSTANEKVVAVLQAYPNPVEPYTQKAIDDAK